LVQIQPPQPIFLTPTLTVGVFYWAFPFNLQIADNRFMPTRKLQSMQLGGSAEELETRFYEALQNGDIEALMACWADEDDIVCVHPGGPRMTGAGAIRASFDAMFANGSIQAKPERIRKVESMSCCVHSVLERISVLTNEGPREAYVIATNVYVKTAQGWRMVAHHASPGTPREMQEISDSPTVLH
jgi:ketosteroid isomerase-like protein